MDRFASIPGEPSSIPTCPLDPAAKLDARPRINSARAPRARRKRKLCGGTVDHQGPTPRTALRIIHGPLARASSTFVQGQGADAMGASILQSPPGKAQTPVIHFSFPLMCRIRRATPVPERKVVECVLVSQANGLEGGFGRYSHQFRTTSRSR